MCSDLNLTLNKSAITVVRDSHQYYIMRCHMAQRCKWKYRVTLFCSPVGRFMLSVHWATGCRQSVVGWLCSVQRWFIVFCQYEETKIISANQKQFFKRSLIIQFPNFVSKYIIDQDENYGICICKWYLNFNSKGFYGMDSTTHWQDHIGPWLAPLYTLFTHSDISDILTS